MIQPGTIVEIVNDKLRITGPDEPPLPDEAEGALYLRSESVLANTTPALYLIQAHYAIEEVMPSVDPQAAMLGMIGAVDAERVAMMVMGYYDGARVVGMGEADPAYLIPWDWRTSTTYTMVVRPGDSAYMLVDGLPAVPRPYDTLPTEPAPPVEGTGIFGFSSAYTVAEYSYVQYCVCESLSYPGPEEKIIISNIVDSPDPFDPSVEDSELSLDLKVLEMPGNPSGQFDFNSRVVWELFSPDGGFLEQTVEVANVLSQTGVHPTSLFWDGTDNEQYDLPSGTYPYKVRVELVRTKLTSGKEQVFDIVETPWMSTTIDRTAPEIVVLDPATRDKIEALEIGSSLHFSARDLDPYSFYDVYLTDTSPTEVSLSNSYSFARIGSDGDGKIPPFILWYQTGVVGCSLNIDPGSVQNEFRFHSFEDAAAVLAGNRLRLAVYSVLVDANGDPLPPSTPRTDSPVTTLKVPIIDRIRPFVYPSLADGCLIHSRPSGSDDLYVTGTNFSPYEEVQVSVVRHRWSRKDNDRLRDVTGRQGSQLRTVADESGQFTIKVWDNAQQHHGAYDIVPIPNPPPPPNPPEQPDDPVWTDVDWQAMILNETGIVLTHPLPPLHASAIDIAVRHLQASPFYPEIYDGDYYLYADAFDSQDETVLAALNPVYAPANQPGGFYAAMWILPHRDLAGWDTSIPGGSNPLNENDDPSGFLEVVPVKDALFSSPVSIWYPPVQYGEWDVIADFGSPAVGHDYLYDFTWNADTDLIDGADRVGFTVLDDPYFGQAPYSHSCFNYDLRDHYVATPIVPGADDIWVDVRGTVCVPWIWGEPPVGGFVEGQHPLFLIQHGKFDYCVNDDWQYPWCPEELWVQSHNGYMSLLENLAANGIIAVSIDAWDLNGQNSPMQYARGELFIKHLELWHYINDPSGSQFASQFTEYSDILPFLEGGVDFSKISLSGHSLGGRATAEAYYQNSFFDIGSISTIGPVCPNAVTLFDIPFFVIIAASDCDVDPTESLGFYNRIPDSSTKSGIHLYGANHNFFNTVWANNVDEQNQPDDQDECFYHGLPDPPDNREDYIQKNDQQRLGAAYLAAFTRFQLNNEVAYKELLRGNLSFPSTAGYKIHHFYHDENYNRLESG
ncbi:hypothetical protein ACFL51_00500, partial [Myxococcota bacterium]